MMQALPAAPRPEASPAAGAAATFDRSSRWLGVARDDGSIAIVDTGRPGLPRRSVTAHQGVSLRLVARPEGEGFVSGGTDGRLVSIAPDGAIATLASAPRRFLDLVAAAPAAGRLVWAAARSLTISGGGRDRVVALAAPVTGLAASANAGVIVTAGDGRLDILTPGTAEARTLAIREAPLKLAVSPCNRFVAASLQGGGIGLWHLADGKGGKVITLPAPALDLAWTLDYLGVPVLIGASGDRLFALSVKTPQAPRWFGPGDGRRITAFAHSQEGAAIAIGTEDGKVIRYSAWSLGELESARPAEGPVSGLGFSGAGFRLGVGFESGAIAQLAPDADDWVI